jgi:hypothetical protein
VPGRNRRLELDDAAPGPEDGGAAQVESLGTNGHAILDLRISYRFDKKTAVVPAYRTAS